MASNVGVNVTINNDFRSCCPRVLRIFGCCVGKPQRVRAEVVNKVAQETIDRASSSSDCSTCVPDSPIRKED